MCFDYLITKCIQNECKLRTNRDDRLLLITDMKTYTIKFSIAALPGDYICCHLSVENYPHASIQSVFYFPISAALVASTTVLTYTPPSPVQIRL